MPDHLPPDAEAARTLQGRVRDLEADLHRKAARIQALEAEGRVKDARLSELRDTNKALELLLAEEARSNAHHAAHAGALLNSTSWRVTAPLRRAVTLLKSLANRP